MLLPAVVFGLVLALILVPYWLFVVRDERRVLRRLTPQSGFRRKGRTNVLKPEESMSSVGTLDTILKGARVAERIQALLDQGAVRNSVGVFLLLSACAALAFLLIVTAVTGIPALGLLAALIAGGLPYAYARRQRRKRLRLFEEQFPEAIELVARALRAGHALPTGLGMVADELRAPAGTEFRILFDEQNFGLTLPDALRNFARRIPILDARFFVTAVLTQRETGGNLAEVLDNLGSVIRERFKVRRQVRVLTAHARISGWILAGLPPALAVATSIISPNHMRIMFVDPVGQQMLVVAATLQIVGTMVIRKLVDVEY